MTNSSLSTFYLGVGLAAAMLGALTGISNTPIAGAVVSTVFAGLVGLAAGVVSARPQLRNLGEVGDKTKSSMQEPPSIKPSDGAGRDSGVSTAARLRLWGISLSVFSTLFVLGALVGGFGRESWIAHHIGRSVTVPWDATNPPATPEEAWMWLSFIHDAGQMGLSTTEVKVLYRRYTEAKQDPSFDADPTWPSYAPGQRKIQEISGPVKP